MYEEIRDLKKFKGGQLLRQKSINEYYLDPNCCLQCKKVIKIKLGDRVFHARQKKFCDRSCSASFNNKNVRRHGNPKRCCDCSKIVSQGVLRCKECKSLKHWENHKKKTLSDIALNGNARIKWASLRQWANRIMKFINRPYKCKLCDFNCKLDVCHIKGINEFSENELCGVVNDPNNLEYLCPNHHKLFDSGIIDIDGNIINKEKCNCDENNVVFTAL